MSHRKDTDYLSISTRIRAMENRLLTAERMDRMIEARDDEEAMKLLAECGYTGTGTLEEILAQARADVFKDLSSAVPDPRLAEVFQLKYDYHNAKTLLKSKATGADPERLLLAGGRYAPQELLEGWRREDLRGCSDTYRRAIIQASVVLEQEKDPQGADLVLDRACYEEMTRLAKELDSKYLQGYVRLSVDIANLRTAVRVSRMGKEAEFLRQVLLPGGSVSRQSLVNARGDGLGEVFQTGLLARAAALGSKLSQPGSGALTAFEKACDDALTDYLTSARLIPFGEEIVIGYLYAREQELTAIRAIFAGRAAGLDGDTIRQRLRKTYV